MSKMDTGSSRWSARTALPHGGESLAEVVTAFTGSAEGDSSWVEGFEGGKLDFS